MKKTSKVILMSVITIVACISLISGATFALFTSESTTNIAITSGKVDVTANVSDVKGWYAVAKEGSESDPKGPVDGDSANLYRYQSASITQSSDDTWSGVFGSASESYGSVTYKAGSDLDSGLTLSSFTPGDLVELTISIMNSSSVSTKYQVQISADSENSELLPALNVKLGDVAATFVGTNTFATAWSAVMEPVAEPTEIQSLTLSVSFPLSAGNEWKDKSCSFTLSVVAVQGNANTPEVMTNGVSIYKESDFAALAQSIEDGAVIENVYLMNDIHFSDISKASYAMALASEPTESGWKPIGSAEHPFTGAFHGNDFTIYDFAATSGDSVPVGFFGAVSGASVDHLHFVGADVTGSVAGVLVGEVKQGGFTVDNVTVQSSALEENTSTQFGGLIGSVADDSNVIVKNTETDIDINGEEQNIEWPDFTDAMKPHIEDGKVIFGSYPQSREDDENITAELNKLAGKLPTSADAGSWVEDKYYQTQSGGAGWYQDVKYNGEMYRGVYFTAIRARVSSGAQSANGYEINNAYWFKFEPIVWRILSQGDRVFLMSDKIIDAQSFYSGNASTEEHPSPNTNNYEQSEVRTWLNEEFYKIAFGPMLQQYILQTQVDNSTVTTNKSKFPCENTNDNIFLPSYQDVTTVAYGFATNSKADSSRVLAATDYAECMGLVIKSGSQTSNYNWYLRSAGDGIGDIFDPKGANSMEVNTVLGTGSCSQTRKTAYSVSGIVPAMNITELFTID